VCYAVKCNTCGKTTWAGCGEHVDSVRRTVPSAQWCTGHPTEQGQGGFFTKLFGR